MTTDDRDIVSEYQQQLAGKVGIERYQVWLRSAASFRLEGREVVVVVRNQFTLDNVRRIFHVEFLSAAEAVIGPQPSIRYEVAESESLVKLAIHQEDEPSQGDSEKDSSPQVATAPRNRLRPRPYSSLQSFVVGSCNKVAFAAANSVIERLGMVSPVFFYGPNGSGKTHLLEGVLSAARKVAGVRRCVYLSAEQFTSQFLEALRGSGLPNFRRKYRDVELLILDDVQFFAGKRATLTELHHTLDSLLRAGKQLVLAADRPPAEMAGLNSELIARMAGGLICPLNLADLETRKGILQQYISNKSLQLPKDLINAIAERIMGDARMLAGAVNRLELANEALGQPIDAALIDSTLSDLFSCTQRAVQLEDIERVVCDVFGLQPKSLQSDRRTKAVSHPRMLAMWLARKYTRAAYSEIGDYFGNRSHSTVISAQKKVNRWVQDGDSIPLAHGKCEVEAAIRRVELQLRTG